METNEDEADPYGALRNEVGNIALKTLKLSTRNNLSLKLDHPMPIPMKSGFFRDWQGIAEIAGYNTSSIMELRKSKTPTETLITHWGKQDDVTLGLLLDALIKIARYDVIDDLFDQLREYAIIYNHNLLSPDVPKFEYQIVEYDHARLKAEELYQNSSESVWNNNNEQLTVGDTSITIERFHAYVCYADEDEPFVRELCEKMEGQFKLCIKDRDLKPGCFEHSAIIKLIQERCDKFIVVLSPAFLASPKFHFQTMFAHACSIEERTRKLVPVIYKKCEVPKIISSLAKLDYNSNTFNNFWYRLKKSLKESNDQSPFSYMRGSNSLPSLRDESLVSTTSSDTSGYSSFYPQQDGNLSNISVQSDFISTEFEENSLQNNESVSESELSVNSRKKKKKLKQALKDNVFLSMIRKKRK